MTRIIGLLCVVLLVACQKPTPTTFTTGGGEVLAEKGRTYRWSFDDVSRGARPDDIINVLGDWKSVADGSRGQKLTVRWDDRPIITVTDATFTKGKIGLWTKADSVTAFDDLEARVE